MTAVVTVTPNPVASGGTAFTIAGTGFETRKTAVLLDGVEIDSFLVTDGTFSVAATASTTATTQHVVVQQCVAGSYLQKATATITVQDSPPGTGPVSGPYGDMTHWKMTFYDPYDRVVAEGHILDGGNPAPAGASFYVTADKRYGVFKDGWHDTSGHGRYDPSTISIDGTKLRIHVQTRDGYPRVAALTPLPSGSTPKGGVPLGIRMAITMRADAMLDYKGIGNLMWADGATTNVLLELYGEGDWGEGNFTGVVHAFMHRTGASSLSDQYVGIPSPDTVSYQDEHEYIQECIYATSWKAYLDGVQVGTTQTSRVPNTTMHVNEQVETALGGAPIPGPSVTGYVDAKWRAVWQYVP